MKRDSKETPGHRLKWEEAERKLTRILFKHPDLEDQSE